ncbi:MAG: DUF2199 domain-containing protein [Mucilaginibacter sp.]
MKPHTLDIFAIIFRDESTLSIPTSVQTKTGGNRPEVTLDPDFDHPFVKDYYNGISVEEAEKRIGEMLGKS